jgi:hypothetical protein
MYGQALRGHSTCLTGVTHACTHVDTHTHTHIFVSGKYRQLECRDVRTSVSPQRCWQAEQALTGTHNNGLCHACGLLTLVTLAVTVPGAGGGSALCFELDFLPTLPTPPPGSGSHSVLRRGTDRGKQ